jgi:hypothetical protein
MPLFCEAFGVAARRAYAVDVTQQIEDRPLSIGSDVGRHPRAFRSGEVDSGRSASRLGDIPGFVGDLGEQGWSQSEQERAAPDDPSTLEPRKYFAHSISHRSFI